MSILYTYLDDAYLGVGGLGIMREVVWACDYVFDRWSAKTLCFDSRLQTRLGLLITGYEKFNNWFKELGLHIVCSDGCILPSSLDPVARWKFWCVCLSSGGGGDQNLANVPRP